jgi:hypothetical protein
VAKLALFDVAQDKWLEFDQDTDLCIEYLDKEAAGELSKAVDKLCVRTGGDRMAVWNQKLGERCLKGWRKRADTGNPGLTFPDGSPIPFTPENRDMLMKRCREISLFVNENAVNPGIFLDQQADGEARDEAKNG